MEPSIGKERCGALAGDSGLLGTCKYAVYTASINKVLPLIAALETRGAITPESPKSNDHL